MAMTKNHPRNCKKCVFCHYWIGDAKLRFINSAVGYEYDGAAVGKCTTRNVNTRTHQSCNNYAPSVEATKLLK